MTLKSQLLSYPQKKKKKKSCVGSDATNLLGLPLFLVSVSDCFRLPIETIEWLKQIRVLYSLLQEIQRWAVQGWWDSSFGMISGAYISDPTFLAYDFTPQGSSWLQDGCCNSRSHCLYSRKEERKGNCRRDTIPAASAL